MAEIPIPAPVPPPVVVAQVVQWQNVPAPLPVPPPVPPPPEPPKLVYTQQTCPKCIYPAAGWYVFRGKQGEKYRCECGTNEFVVGMDINGYPVYHLIFKRGISLDRRMPGWQYYGRSRKVYVTCICTSMIPIALKDIADDCYVGGRQANTCLICPYCLRHTWPYLAGWTEVALKRKKGREKRARAAARKHALATQPPAESE